ncbi:MAG: divalent cation tolerance protein CutA [Candidatus Kerfeldbacteria bacterium]|nr:divalent cation tolerance protein CutA [Candidatus Kerfeldbacteria bacterium]
MTIRQIIINCNSTAEAVKIGKAVLKKRFAACYDVVPRLATGYYWPPRKSSRLTTGKGAMLFLTTQPRHVAKAMLLAKKLHTDRVPMMGTIMLNDVPRSYYDWLVNELAPHA